MFDFQPYQEIIKIKKTKVQVLIDIYMYLLSLLQEYQQEYNEITKNKKIKKSKVSTFRVAEAWQYIQSVSELIENMEQKINAEELSIQELESLIETAKIWLTLNSDSEEVRGLLDPEFINEQHRLLEYLPH